MTEPITKSEAIVLIDERIAAHDDSIDLPRHRENKELLAMFSSKLDALIIDVTKMVASQEIVMKFAGAGIVIWAIKQIVDIAHTFAH